jgi:hypothetical protein
MLLVLALIISLAVFAVLFFSGGEGRRLGLRALAADQRGGVGNRFAYGNVSLGLFRKLLAASGGSVAPAATGPGQTLQSGVGPGFIAQWDYAENLIAPEAFGAVGDGVTNDYAAMQAAVATGRGIVLSEGKTYLLNGASPAIDLAAGQSIQGQGDGSILKTTSNITVIRANAQNTLISNLKIVGNSAGGNQFGVASTDLSGGAGTKFLRIHNCTIMSMGMAGVILFNAAEADNIGPQIVGCRFTNCNIGMWCITEYTVILGCILTSCNDGIRVQAGNITVVDCTITDSAANGIRIVAGGNDGHGCVSGCEINHNTVDVLVDDGLANGMPFVGCNVYGTGGIVVGTAGGVGAHAARFLSCAIAAPVVVHSLSDAIFDACLWPLAPTTITIDATAKARFEPNNVDLNGQFPASLTAAFVAQPFAWVHDVQGLMQLEPIARPAALPGSARIFLDASDGIVKIIGSAGTLTPIGPA